MIKQTIFFSTPCYLSVKHKQLCVRPKGKDIEHIVPIEDVGYIILENHSITLSLKLIELLNQYNIAAIFCDSKHMPCAMLQTFSGHSTYAETARNQVEVKQPLKKQLWKKIVEHKIANQAKVLKKHGFDSSKRLELLSKDVTSNDSSNREAVAARIYWQSLFADSDFVRSREGEFPNNLLNYGYAILRGATARALSGSGLSLQFGIYHHNRYNAFCLADDIMEPFRPFLDEIVLSCYKDVKDGELTKEIKAKLLEILVSDVRIIKRTPLMIALTTVSASLAKSFNEGKDLLLLPNLE
ncbi:MAG: type II CRISPR-associated endonuclease Cas1 [Kiritimatiellae bacterium]|jgi:CRISPR-associated protein Cas1|nr:type II CRISPR-associated endonuclease Cas1 [Kiritimatiellia bacterium]